MCDSEQAVRLLRRALSMDPTRTDCKSLLVSSLLDEDESPQNLIPLATEVVAEQPDWVSPKQQLAILYDMVGNRERADREAQEAIQLIGIHRNSGKYGVYSYFEACVTGRYVRECAEQTFLERLRWLRENRSSAG